MRHATHKPMLPLQKKSSGKEKLAPADAYFGRADTIIKQRERINKQTIERRRLQHRKLAA